MTSNSITESADLSLLPMISAIVHACQCLFSVLVFSFINLYRPVLTYGMKGCKKKGVKPEKHGIIYENGTKARLLDREPRLGFEPIAIDIEEEGERVAKETRVNYSKLVSVEHNFRILFIGSIIPQHMDILSDAVNLCWEAKVQKRKHRHF